MDELTIKVRTLREMYGYSQEAIAYQLGISQAAYCKRESGKTRFTFECIQKLAEVYQLPMTELISRTAQELALQALNKRHPSAA